MHICTAQEIKCLALYLNRLKLKHSKPKYPICTSQTLTVSSGNTPNLTLGRNWREDKLDSSLLPVSNLVSSIMAQPTATLNTLLLCLMLYLCFKQKQRAPRRRRFVLRVLKARRARRAFDIHRQSTLRLVIFVYHLQLIF